MAGVNWDGTEKVMEHQSCHTVTFTDDVILNPMSFENKSGKVRPAPPKKSGKVRPVIVKFVRYNDRKKIYANKKLLKGTKVSITESLTAQHVEKLKEAKEKYDFKNVWSNDGRITYKDNGGDKTKIYFD